jgi:GNAT superfamily N-acetyltransferase
MTKPSTEVRFVTEAELVVYPAPNEALRQLVAGGVDSYNLTATGITEWHPANLFLRSTNGEWLGGLLGTIWGGWLDVRHLFIVEGARQCGHGRRLLQAAENLALGHGCFAATLETHSFQALPFYKKQGYEVFGQLDDYPTGHAKLYLKKRLAQGDAPLR